MNFKIYIQKGLIKHISSLEDINYFEFSHSNFTEKINNHIASKISQCFLFFIEYEFLKILNSYMSSFKEAQYQFIIVGHSFDETIKSSLEVPFNKILGISRHFISKEELDWYLFKFEICINYEKHNLNLSDAVKKDFLDDQYELITIGQMLAEERDRDKLIKKILMTSIKITGSDAGCVFLVVDQKGGDKGLLFKYSYTFSRNIDFREFVMPLDESSISGFCAINDEVVNIPDVYHISKDATFSFNRSIDEKYAYISKSMLVIPMKNHLGEMLGVIELINSKENFSLENNSGEVEAHKILLETVEDFETKVFPFAVRYEDIMLSVAGQASIALDNIKMLKQLEDQFEGMVRASVDAIDSKDPATSGHSFRLAKMSVKFLEVLNSLNIGVYKEVFFSPMEIKQMEYAALLHDYGKVYINNEIFLKAKKLFPKDFSILKLRL
ncbi:MAG: GAF domain-containing protein, partial [Spirochaetales bacterium]|nr:GAF domain-containing protein [Spirochaetales bacterium]